MDAQELNKWVPRLFWGVAILTAVNVFGPLTQFWPSQCCNACEPRVIGSGQVPGELAPVDTGIGPLPPDYDFVRVGDTIYVRLASGFTQQNYRISIVRRGTETIKKFLTPRSSVGFVVQP